MKRLIADPFGRRERPETHINITALVIAVILYIPYIIIVLAIVVGKSFLRMARKFALFTGKFREKLLCRKSDESA